MAEPPPIPSTPPNIPPTRPIGLVGGMFGACMSDRPGDRVHKCDAYGYSLGAVLVDQEKSNEAGDHEAGTAEPQKPAEDPGSKSQDSQ